MKVLALLMLLPSIAFGQFAVDMPMDSPRAPFSIGASYAASIQFEGVSATGATVLIGSAVKMPINFVHSPFVIADIPGSKTVVATATALRVTFTVTGLVGWKQRGTWAVSSENFATPIAIAPGQKVGCRYDMPTQVWSFDVNTGIMSWGPPGSGRLRCQPGVLAASIPAPTATPAPVPAPVPVPAPSPGTTTLKMPPLSTIVDTNGTWTAGPMTDAGTAGQVAIFLNGVQLKNSVTFICATAGEMWDFDPPPPAGSGQGWEKWDATAKTWARCRQPGRQHVNDERERNHETRDSRRPSRAGFLALRLCANPADPPGSRSRRSRALRAHRRRQGPGRRAEGGGEMCAGGLRSAPPRLHRPVPAVLPAPGHAGHPGTGVLQELHGRERLQVRVAAHGLHRRMMRPGRVPSSTTTRPFLFSQRSRSAAVRISSPVPFSRRCRNP